MGYFGFLYEEKIENFKTKNKENKHFKVIGFQTDYKFNIVLGVLENMPKDYKIYFSSSNQKVKVIVLEKFRYCKIDLTTNKQLIDFPNNICMCNLTLYKKLRNMLSQNVDLEKIKFLRHFFSLD